MSCDDPRTDRVRHHDSGAIGLTSDAETTVLETVGEMCIRDRAKPPEPAKPTPEGEGEAKDAEANEDGDDPQAKPAKDVGEEE